MDAAGGKVGCGLEQHNTLYHIFEEDQKQHPMPAEKAKQLRQTLWQLLLTHPPNTGN